jgi:hypothetical protein
VTGAEAVPAWITASRAASKVPAKVEDEATLLQVAGMLLAARRQRGEGGGGRARAS